MNAATTDGIRARLTDGVKLSDKVEIKLPHEAGDGNRAQPITTR